MKKRYIFYGWWIVSACFIFVFIYAGIGYYSFGPLWEALIDDPAIDWGMGELTRSFTIVYIVVALSSPFIGRIIDNYGPAKTIATGAIIMSAGLALLSITDSLWHYYLCHGMLGLGMSASGFMPASAVISRWFVRKRGLAIGITMAGIGVGGMVLTPIIGNILIPNLGWSKTYLVLAALTCALILPLALKVIKTSPRDMGLRPDGAEMVQRAQGIRPSTSMMASTWTRSMAIRTVPFWIITLAFSASSFGFTGVVQNQTRYLNDIYKSVPSIAGQIPAILGMVGIGSVLSKTLFGWLTDKIGARICSIICYSCSIIAVLILMNVNSATNAAVLWIYAFVQGLGMGGWASITPLMISKGFGLRYFGAILGVINLPLQLSTALGPMIAGTIYDSYTSYSPVFIYSLVLPATAILGMIFYRPPKQKTASS